MSCDNDNKIHLNDVGTAIIVTIYEVAIIDGEENSTILDISDQVELKIKAMHKSGRAYFYEDMTFVTDGTDGQCKFITTALATFTMTGTWTIQVYYESASGQWHSTSFEIEVLPIITIPA